MQIILRDNVPQGGPVAYVKAGLSDSREAEAGFTEALAYSKGNI